MKLFGIFFDSKLLFCSGVAGPLAAWCGSQICRPTVLGFGKWIACLKPGVLMP